MAQIRSNPDNRPTQRQENEKYSTNSMAMAQNNIKEVDAGANQIQTYMNQNFNQTIYSPRVQGNMTIGTENSLDSGFNTDRDQALYTGEGYVP